MSVRRLLPWAVLGLAGLGAAAALVLAGQGGSGGEGPEPPLGDEAISAVATISPEVHFAGDPVLATIDLTVNRKLTEPAGVHVLPVFRPYSLVGQVEVERHDVGRLTLLRYTFPIQCVDRPCLAVASSGTLRLPSAIVQYASPFGQGLLGVAWPPLTLVSRLRAGELEDPVFRTGSLEPPAPSYRIPPHVLGWLFASLAAAFVVAAGALVARRLRTTPADRPVEAVPAALGGTSIERALALLEGAQSRGEAERRAALDALARALDGDGLAAFVPRVRRLAWSQSAPAPSEMDELAGEVRRTLEQGGSG